MLQMPREQAREPKPRAKAPILSATYSAALGAQKLWAVVCLTTRAELFHNFINQTDCSLRFLSCIYNCEYCFSKEVTKYS